MKNNFHASTISYLSSDGKPEKSSLLEIFKVTNNRYQTISVYSVSVFSLLFFFSWNCMPLTPPTRKPLLLRTFMKEQMFWLQTLLLSALNHQKNLQSHVQWELNSLLLTWNGHHQKKSSSLHYLKMNGLSAQ